MNKLSSISWVAFSALTVFTSCEKPPGAKLAGPPEVLVTEVIQKEVPVIREFVGTLNGVENAQVRAREVGYLQSIAYQQGGYVKKGDLLFEIDPRPFIAALDQAKGQLQEAQATLAGVEFEAKAAKELFEKKVISEQQYSNETQDYQTKLAAVAAAQAAVDNAQLNLSYTKITSPLNGIAGEQQAQIGDLVGTGTNQVLTTVSQIDPMWFFLPISEQTYWQFADALKAAMIRPEAERPAKVELILADGSVYPHKGKFAFVGRYVDEKTGTIQIAVSFPNPELTLRPGQYGRARAEIETIPDALLIPQQALSQLQGYDQVAVVNPDGKAEIRAVKVGQLYDRNMIVVTQGLKLGEKVIVEGFQRVRQGMEVSAKPYTDVSTTQGAQDDSENDSTNQSKTAASGQKSGESGVRPSE
jgi:RND family efflux transporter MFP subunit